MNLFSTWCGVIIIATFIGLTTSNSTNFETFCKASPDLTTCSELADKSDKIIRTVENFFFTKSKLACIRYKNRRLLNNFSKHFQNIAYRDIPIFVLGGRKAHPFEFPHILALGFYNPSENRYEFKCGGTLISPTFVLTAAHCIRNPQGEEVKIVRRGTIVVPDFISMPDPVMDIGVKNVIVHEGHDDRKKINDIALLELETDATSGEIQPICLYTKNDDPGQFEVTGWGVTEFDGDDKSSSLQVAVVSFVAQEECKKIIADKFKKSIDSTHICAGDDNQNTCPGDSGGPLLFKEHGDTYLVGVTSYGDYCGTRTPGVYTRVSRFLDWIEEKVWP